MSVSLVKVSILCITYNHKDYIRQCLDGFLMQEANFEYEIIINDDASTDGTQEIIKEYQKKYPGKIRAVLQKENQHSRGGRSFFIRFLFPKARGKYLALCEGDDFWTDPKKLQKQVDFLDKRPDYVICFHPVRVFFENGERKDSVYPNPNEESDFTLSGLLKANFIQTNSVMYRKQNYEKIAIGLMPGDWYLHLYHAQFGKIGFIDKTMSVYRRHSEGLWWESDKNLDAIWKKHGLSHMALYAEMLKLYGDKKVHRETIYKHIEKLTITLFEIDQKYKESLVGQVVLSYPNIITNILMKCLKDIDQYRKDKDYLLSENVKLQETALSKDTELRRVKASIFWKTRNKAAGFIGKEKI